MTICKNVTGYIYIGAMILFLNIFSLFPFISSWTLPGITILLQMFFFLMLLIFPTFSIHPRFAKIHYVLVILAFGYIYSVYSILSTLSSSSFGSILVTILTFSIPLTIQIFYIYFLGKCCKRDGVSLKPYYETILIESGTTIKVHYSEKVSETKPKIDQKNHEHSKVFDFESNSSHICNGCTQDQSEIRMRNTIINLEPVYMLAVTFGSFFISIFAFVFGGPVFTGSEALVNGVPWYPSEAISNSIGLGVIVLGFTLVYQGIFFYVTYAFSCLTTDSIFKKIHFIIALLPIGYFYGFYLILSYYFSNIYNLILITANCSFIPTLLLVSAVFLIEKHSSNTN